MKKVALLGGSFNPPHNGHFEAARYLHRALGVDEVWMLFSENHFKDPADYVSFDDRMTMGEIMRAQYPDVPIVLSDFEERYGIHLTSDVLAKLREHYPDHRFIWTMGADNLASFHEWHNHENILEHHPVAVVGRSSYIEKALKSPTALTYAYLKRKDSKDIADSPNGWIMLENNPGRESSTDLRNRLRMVRPNLTGLFRLWPITFANADFMVMAYRRRCHLCRQMRFKAFSRSGRC